MAALCVQWVDSATKRTEKKCRMLLLAVKKDLVDAGQLVLSTSPEEIEKMASTYGEMHFC